MRTTTELIGYSPSTQHGACGFLSVFFTVWASAANSAMQEKRATNSIRWILHPMVRYFQSIQVYACG
jgi:hypothetical protein